MRRRESVLMGLVGGIVAAARPAQAGLFGGISEDVYVSDTVGFFLSSFFPLLTFVDDAHQALTRTQTLSISFSVYSAGRRRSLGC